MNEHSYLEMKVDVIRSDLEFDKSLKKFDFKELSDQISYYPITIELFEKNEEDNTQKSIAFLDGYYYDMDYIYDCNINPFDVFDMINVDTEVLYGILFDETGNVKPEYQMFNHNIFYLNRIYVEKEYRNNGYAKLLLNQLDEILKYIAKINVGIVVVCAQSFERNGIEEEMIRDDRKLKENLIKLYKNAGFKETDSYYDYLVKVIDY